MPKTFNSIWLHIVFRTKLSRPYLSWEIRNEVCEYIKTKGNLKGYNVDTVNGVRDHLHVLLRIKTTQTVAEAVHWIKGASSRWLNTKYNWKDGFAWQEGYGVFSVSLHDIKMIRNYIYNQEKHHKENSCVDRFEYVPKSSEEGRS
ncbi:IS200/IS605 family transposase [Gracilimonas tropica]|uniref:IS200/IS605 family transposase n=1 Tax=Gracilimonas tropica TaxID=454600 RepID=UPI0003722303|nr:IS200/IS605 family transposase [Gracilimonas tropica]